MNYLILNQSLLSLLQTPPDRAFLLEPNKVLLLSLLRYFPFCRSCETLGKRIKSVGKYLHNSIGEPTTVTVSVRPRNNVKFIYMFCPFSPLLPFPFSALFFLVFTIHLAWNEHKKCFTTYLDFAKSNRVLEQHVRLVQSFSFSAADSVAKIIYSYLSLSRFTSLSGFILILPSSFWLCFVYLWNNSLQMMIHIHKRIHQQQQHMYGTGCLILNPISFSFYLVHLWFIVLGIFFSFSFLILFPLSFTTITEWAVCCVVSLVYDDPFNFYDDRCWKEDWDGKIYFGWIRNAFQFIWI